MPHDPMGHAEPILRRIPHDRCVGVELGVNDGQLSGRLLSERPLLSLWMVDLWQTWTAADDYGRWCEVHSDPSGLRSAEETARAYGMAQEVADIHQGRGCCLRMATTAAAGLFPERSLDFVFVDADHRETGCFDDIHRWWPKVRVGGWIGGHDYDRPCFDGGVKRAVHRFFDHRADDIEIDANWTWFVRRTA